MKQKTLSAFRIDERSFGHIDKAIAKYNKDPTHLAKLTKNDFRRLALELMAQSIIQDVPLPVQLQMQLNASTDI